MGAGESSTDDWPGVTGRLEIDLDALQRNYRRLVTMAGAAECAGVVKADGYGLGIVRVASALAGAGCKTFFVATPLEGEALRGAVPEATIYVLDGLVPGAAARLVAANLRPVLGSPVEIDAWKTCGLHNPLPPAALHVDTGMQRLGLGPRDIADLENDPAPLRGLTIDLIMSHLACGDVPDDPMTATQIAAFSAARSLTPQARASLANSAGTIAHPQSHFDLVRPGIAIYGGRAVEGREKPTECVATLRARVLQVREAEAGATVGYGAVQRLSTPRRLATIAVGYGDGFPRHLSSRDGVPGGQIFAGGRACPIVGRISMDLTIADITDLPQGAVRSGDWVELFGANNDLDEVADAAGTIGYELLTQLGARYERSYVAGDTD